MRRRSRSKPISLMTAVLVEMGTMIGIIAIAQPTWTRGVIESVATPAAGLHVGQVAGQVGINEPSEANSSGFRSPPNDVSALNRTTQWQPTAESRPTDGLRSAAWSEAAPRVAQANPLPNSSWNNPQGIYPQPIMPPPIGSMGAVGWSSGYGSHPNSF